MLCPYLAVLRGALHVNPGPLTSQPARKIVVQGLVELRGHPIVPRPKALALKALRDAKKPVGLCIDSAPSIRGGEAYPRLKTSFLQCSDM